MKIDLVYPELPPARDAIGEYTARLAAELAGAGHRVRVLTARGGVGDPIPGVERVEAYGLGSRSSMARLADAVRAGRPDAVVVQYNPFSWGRRGFNPWLASVGRRNAEGVPRLAVMFHETWMMNPGWRGWAMRQWQRPQCRGLERIAAVRFCSIAAWTREMAARNAGRGPTVHLPVGSNLPDQPTMTREAARVTAGLREDAFVCGLFGGGNHPSKLLGLVGEAVRAVRRAGRDATLLYVGADAPAVQAACGPEVPVVCTGYVGPGEAAAYVSAMDLMLAPFVDGLSTRRGSAMAALQHGVATLSTRGRLTDPVWSASLAAVELADPAAEPFAAAAAALATDDPRRTRLGRHGQDAYRARFDWPVIAASVVGVLAARDGPASAAAVQGDIAAGVL